MGKQEQGSRLENELNDQPIWVTEEGVLALAREIERARQKLADKTLEMGRAASNGDKDYHENAVFRDLKVEVLGPVSRKLRDLLEKQRRIRIGYGQGNFDRQLIAKIEAEESANTEVTAIRLVGPIEVNYTGSTGPNGETNISYESPLGKNSFMPNWKKGLPTNLTHLLAIVR